MKTEQLIQVKRAEHGSLRGVWEAAGQGRGFGVFWRRLQMEGLGCLALTARRKREYRWEGQGGRLTCGASAGISTEGDVYTLGVVHTLGKCIEEGLTWVYVEMHVDGIVAGDGG